MKRMLAAAVVALVIVATASAKAPPNGFRVCGPQACAAIDGDGAEQLAVTMFYSSAGHRWDAPPVTTPFYAIHWQWNDGGVIQTAYYVPAIGAVRYPPSTTGQLSNPFGWTILGMTPVALLERLTSSLDAYIGAEVIRVTVNGKAVANPATYAQLWTIGKPRTAWSATAWLRVKIATNIPSPWAGTLYIARRGALLMRDDTVFRIPRQLAARIRARASLG